MGFKCGIVGLPNVGKSTLFNALTNSSKAQAENFPFCTIDPNIGLVPVPDKRLENLVSISNSKKKIHTTISFVDIAGLVKGASKGEGLGNKFLSHIREVDAIIHMIRCFDSNDIQNVNSTVDPVRDLEIIETEMKLADLESVQKRLDKKNKKNIDENQRKLLEKVMKIINDDKEFSILNDEFQKKDLINSGLLSAKPKLYVCNVDEKSIEKGNNYTKSFTDKFGKKNTLIISADIEKAITEKVEAEQLALKQKYVLEKERQEAERKRIEAEGIADFQRIVNQTITPQLLRWKGVEATQEIAKSNNAKVIVVGNGDGDLPIILGGNK